VPLSRRVAVVTGGSSGIGAAIARSLATREWQLVLLARGEERLNAVAEELDAERHVCDVSDRAEVERVAAEIRARHPSVHLLVNNAGIPGREGFLTLDPERVEALVRVNYLGSVWCTRAFLPALEAAAPSNLVTVVSVAGTVAAGQSGPYTASKHAQLAFSRSLAVELSDRGVRVHTVNPGFVDTPGFPNRNRFGARLAPLVAEPDTVAAAVLRALDKNRGELFVPWWYRPAAVAQALAPGLLARAARSRGIRRIRS
jgi:short-subunit dehydrogenase